MTCLYDLFFYLCMGIGVSCLLGSLIGLLISIFSLKRMFFDTDVEDKKPTKKPFEFNLKRNIW